MLLLQVFKPQCWKGLCEKPFQVIVTWDSAPSDNFLRGFGFFPLSFHNPLNPAALLWPKRTHPPPPPLCSKFNFVLGGRGSVASFTNITGKVPTLLTSIIAYNISTNQHKYIILSKVFFVLDWGNS